ncbi:hypothetical protein DPMN_001645 [Dreissena polymorpha]|uniref:Uncharacterized protein n=1 Tax=Dreissena polymorpha TaxID=45954 RepID=A0A9D4MM32_DREPO|nr:hypothetical protein DPMN_001645 [Dreissena polymorpha]
MMSAVRDTRRTIRKLSQAAERSSRCPRFRGETLTTEGLHADDECRSTINNHHS